MFDYSMLYYSIILFRAGRRVRGTGSSKPLESAEDSISEDTIL